MKTFLMPTVTVIVWFLFKTKEITMNKIIAIVASVFALNAFAADPAPAKKEEAKPTASAPAKVTAPAKSEAKTAPAKEVKAAK
jgi:hypothetical protein